MDAAWQKSESTARSKTRGHPRSELTERLERLTQARFTAEHVAASEEAAALDTSQSTSMDLAESERTLLLGFDRLRVVPWAILTAVEQEWVEHEGR
jgi:hypothetical protein